MIDGVDTSQWNGISTIRDRLRVSGFGLPDQYARLASAYCDGLFTPDEWTRESENYALRYIRQVYPDNAPVRDGPLWTALAHRTSVEGIHFKMQEVSTPLAELKFAEMPPEARAEPHIIKSNQIRAHAERYAKGLGFIPNDTLDSFFYRPMSKHLDKSNITGFFHVNPEVRAFPFPRNTGVSFFVHRPIEGLDIVPVWLDSLVWGMAEYSRINYQIRASIMATERSEPLMSAAAKWGLQAQLTLFDAFLETLNDPSLLGLPRNAH